MAAGADGSAAGEERSRAGGAAQTAGQWEGRSASAKALRRRSALCAAIPLQSLRRCVRPVLACAAGCADGGVMSERAAAAAGSRVEGGAGRRSDSDASGCGRRFQCSSGGMQRRWVREGVAPQTGLHCTALQMMAGDGGRSACSPLPQSPAARCCASWAALDCGVIWSAQCGLTTAPTHALHCTLHWRRRMADGRPFPFDSPSIRI